MVKNILRFILLIIGLSAIGYGGYTIYQKQVFPISHKSFAPEGSVQVYVPDVESLKAKNNGFNILESYAGAQWLPIINMFSDAANAPFSFQINITGANQVISFKGFTDLFFTGQLSQDLTTQKGTITINEVVYHYWKNNEYLALSPTEIQIQNIKKQTDLNIGNADFFFQGNDGVVEAIKLTEKVMFSAYMASDSLLRGKPINPMKVLSVCPTSAQLVNFYGSSRFVDDASTLQGTTTANHLSWVNSELLYIQKDSFEVLVGLQNDGIQLKNLILEAMAEKAGDSWMKSSIYFNNIEIIPFQIDWDWKSVSGDLKTEMKYFAALNDFVFLSNNLKAMYWVLKNIQLGKTYNELELSKKIPSRVNFLSLQKAESGMAITSKTWINSHRTINLAAMSNRVLPGKAEQLIAEFDHIESSKYVLFTEGVDNSQVISVSEKVLKAYNLSGELLWEYQTESSISVQPKVVGAKQSAAILVAAGTNLVLLNTKGQVLNSFKKSLPSAINKLQVISNKTDTLLLASTKNSVYIYDLNGTQKATSIPSFSAILSAQLQLFGDAEALTVFTGNDSVFVFNLKDGSKLGAIKNDLNSAILKPIVEGEKLPSESLKLLTFDGGYLKMKYFSNNTKDSTKINTSVKPDKTHWINFKGKWFLVYESFDQLLVFNSLGLSEIEIAKPEPNSVFVPQNFIESGIFAFLNKETNKWHFTDEYGNLLIKNPIENEGLTFLYKNILVSKSQNRIHIYNTH